MLPGLICHLMDMHSYFQLFAELSSFATNFTANIFTKFKKFKSRCICKDFRTTKFNPKQFPSSIFMQTSQMHQHYMKYERDQNMPDKFPKKHLFVAV